MGKIIVLQLKCAMFRQYFDAQWLYNEKMVDLQIVSWDIPETQDMISK